MTDTAGMHRSYLGYLSLITSPKHGTLTFPPSGGLADDLRMEVLRYSCPASTYTIHCAFPVDFISPGLLLEQNTKTELTKGFKNENCTISDLESRFPPSGKVVPLIIGAVGKGDFIICNNSMASLLIFANMIGPSPKRE